MKCKDCIFLEDFGDCYKCTNHDSIHYMEPKSPCSEEECFDGEDWEDRHK